MPQLGQHRWSVDVTTRPNDAGAADTKLEAHYCGLCGQPVGASAAGVERFGETFCSEAHAQEFLDAVRSARVQAAAGLPTTIHGPNAADPPLPRSWKASIGKVLCWGAPLLVIALVLAGGTGAVTGAAGAVLPFLAALACPLGMYFMMRSMSKTGGRGDPRHQDRDR